MKNLLGMIMVSTLLLGACNVDREPPRPGPYGENDTEEGVDSLSDNEIPGTNTDSAEEETDTETEWTDSEDEESADQAIDLSIVMDEDFEETDWDNVRLTRREFDSMLFEMQDNLNSEYEQADEMEIVIDSIDFSDDTLHISLTNHDESDFAEFSAGFFAVFVDSLYRQLYLHSEYSDGTTHPRIIVQHTGGDVITDQKEFIEFEE